MGEVDKIIQEISPYYKKTKSPASSHKLVYDSPSETLEPIYFWILDFMNDMFQGKVDKLIDNFASSPGGGHFDELGRRKTVMQQQAANVMATIGTLLKSVINIMYDLKEFKIRLTHYDEANSTNADEKTAGLLSLKQIWMDKVDMQRGMGSINQMSSGNLQFVTLRDAFLKVDTLKDVERLDLNDRVKRVLMPRLQEFFTWQKTSYAELKKRYDVERAWLKSQVDSLKMNSRWAKPYLKAAHQLETNESLASNASVVSVFNTMLLELSLLGKSPLDVKSSAIAGDLPREFRKLKNLREYNSIVTVDFKFRGIPSKVNQQSHYTFGGRADVVFNSYALNNEEIELLKKKLEDSDLFDALKLVQGATEESLGILKEELDEFLNEEYDKVEEKKQQDDINPFSALFSLIIPAKKEKKKKKKEDEEKENIEEIEKKVNKKESYFERYIRRLAEANAVNSCFTVYDIYKKAHGMAAFPYKDDAETEVPRTGAEEFFNVG